MIETFLSQPSFQALGWTLIHFIWQGALVAALFVGIRQMLRGYSADARYAAACAAMLLILILPLATFFIIRSSFIDAHVDRQTSTSAQVAATPLQQKMDSAHKEVLSPGEIDPDEILPPETMPSRKWTEYSFASLLPWLVLIWLAGALTLSLRLAGGWIAVRRIKLRRTNEAAREWQETVSRLSRRLRVSGPVRLCESVLVEVPTVIGWLRPVILMPLSIWAGLSAEQVEALLAHELAHIRRHDYLVNLLQTAIETLLFYHPAVWWISRQVRTEREHCCDDLAVKTCGDVLVYARALTTLEELRRHRDTSQLALAASGGSLLQRIRRLIETPKSSPATHSPWLAGFVVIIASLGLFAGVDRTLFSQEIAASDLRNSPSSPKPAQREVAVTLYSLPYMRSSQDDLPEVGKTLGKLLKTITSNNIPAVGFVGEKGLYKGGQSGGARISPLKMWLDAGLELGTQTFSHRWLYNTPLEDYEADVVRGETLTRPLLKERGQPLKYFLYPYLNTGPNLETKVAFEKFLAERGYTFVPVTIDNMDWLFAQVYDEALKRGDVDVMKRTGEEYLPYMEKMFEFYERLSVDVVGYEVPQVLMLTASRLNADFLEDLVRMLKRRGYSFISLEQAMKDKAYAQPDKYTGPVGISWLQRWAITKGMGFRKEPPLPSFMQQFDKRGASRSDFKTD
jgi:beta-lactamase regulating signal transducer with metallopeptidase domain/peptidoglycan/xylan/chitin deacetylase (PgdA/CDA1 family)